MSTELVHLGFGNILAVNKVIAIIPPNSEPTKRLVQETKGKGLTIDMTKGRRTKAVLIMENGHIVLAALTPETIAGRVAAGRAGPGLKQSEQESGAE